MVDKPESASRIDELLDAASEGQRQAMDKAIYRAQLLSESDSRDWYFGRIIRVLVQTAELDKAIELMELIHHPLEKKDALLQVANALITMGQIEQSEQKLEEVEKILPTIAGEAYSMWQRAEALDQIALLRLRVGQRDRALVLWQQAIGAAQAGQRNDSTPQEIWDSAGVLAEIACHLAAAGQVVLARTVASEIRIENKRQSAIETITRIERD